MELPNRFVVTGLPASGKTTWVEQRRKPGDLVWDRDCIADAMFQLPTYGNPQHVIDFLHQMLCELVRAARNWQEEKHSTYIIITDPNHARKVAEQISGKLITIVRNDDDRRNYLKQREISEKERFKAAHGVAPIKTFA